MLGVALIPCCSNAAPNPQQCDVAHWEVAAAQPRSLPGKAQDKAVVLLPIICIEPHKP
jgi:hypothetical protein